MTSEENEIAFCEAQLCLDSVIFRRRWLFLEIAPILGSGIIYRPVVLLRVPRLKNGTCITRGVPLLLVLVPSSI